MCVHCMRHATPVAYNATGRSEVVGSPATLDHDIASMTHVKWDAKERTSGNASTGANTKSSSDGLPIDAERLRLEQ